MIGIYPKLLVLSQHNARYKCLNLSFLPGSAKFLCFTLVQFRRLSLLHKKHVNFSLILRLNFSSMNTAEFVFY